MHRKSWNLALINIIGGIAVISSYVHGLLTTEARAGALWGGVPEELQSFYTISMLCAAAGYFPFTYFFVRCVDPDDSRFAGGTGFTLVSVCYVAILAASSFWLPMTTQMSRSPSTFLWILIRLDLAVVALGTIGLIVAATTIQPRTFRPVTRIAALVGLAFFAVQTVLLDAIVWPAYFPR